MKNLINNIKNNYKLVIGFLLAGIILGWLITGNTGESREINEPVDIHEGHDHELDENTVWTCSMHPQIRQDEPGLCPICAMELIPVAMDESEGSDHDINEIQMSEAAMALSSVQTAVVSRGSAVKTVHLQGKVLADERNISQLTARFGGRIEELLVNFTGSRVDEGQPLAFIYSPDLVSAQKELIEAARNKDVNQNLYNAALNRLKLWNLSDEQIAALEKNEEIQDYFEVLSPLSGTVTQRNVAKGDYVEEGTVLFEVTDLSRLWVIFDAYESDLPWISENAIVNFTVQSLPGKTFSGRISYVDPYIDPETRVAKVRIEIANTANDLKPGMFAGGNIQSVINRGAGELLIPRSSVLWTGKRAVVYVKVPDREINTFLHREILLGEEAGEYYVVREGLEEGEVIATNGVFKIDAAAQLAGKTSMMNAAGGGTESVITHH